jgi:hypothetical protein
LGELTIYLKICGSQTNFLQFHSGFSLQGRLFIKGVTVMEFITDDLQGLSNWYIGEETDSVKAN